MENSVYFFIVTACYAAVLFFIVFSIICICFSCCFFAVDMFYLGGGSIRNRLSTFAYTLNSQILSRVYRKQSLYLHKVGIRLHIHHPLYTTNMGLYWVYWWWWCLCECPHPKDCRSNPQIW